MYRSTSSRGTPSCGQSRETGACQGPASLLRRGAGAHPRPDRGGLDAINPCRRAALGWNRQRSSATSGPTSVRAGLRHAGGPPRRDPEQVRAHVRERVGYSPAGRFVFQQCTTSSPSFPREHRRHDGLGESHGRSLSARQTGTADVPCRSGGAHAGARNRSSPVAQTDSRTRWSSSCSLAP